MKVYLICGVKVEFLDWNIPIFAKNLNKKKKKNLPKIGRLSFFHYPPVISTTFPPPSPRKIDPVPNGNDLGHYMTSYMMSILSKFEMLEITFVNE